MFRMYKTAVILVALIIVGVIGAIADLLGYK